MKTLTVKQSLIASSLVIVFCICGLGRVFGADATTETTTVSQTAAPKEKLPPLVALRIVPEKMQLWGAKANHRFIALAKFSDGLERDMTDRAVFKLSDGNLASLKEGRVHAAADGKVELKAELEGKTASAQVEISGSQEVRPFSFARDVGQIFTRRGCNATDCHGSVAGQKGFKLSLNGAYPKEDFKWIVEGGHYKVLTTEQTETPKPRINKEKPEESLILQKPTRTVAHGGGKRFEVGSPDYQVILEWIRKGAPYGEEQTEKTPILTAIEVLPGEAILTAGGRQQLLVQGVWSNGRREDITDQVSFASNNEEVAGVSEEGIVEAGRMGETAILIRASGKVASAEVGVIGKSIENYPDVPKRNFIDEYIFAKLRKLNIVPSGLSSDEEFLRRVCLDLAGILPPPERIHEFVADASSDKRDKLIEVLLESPEFIDLCSYRIGDILRVFYSARESQKETSLSNEWVHNCVMRNVRWNKIAHDYIAAAGYGGLTQNFHLFNDRRTAAEIMAEQVRVFAGIRLECAECHNHPFESWSQDQFWGMAAFYNSWNQLGPKNVIIDMPRDLAGFEGNSKLKHPRTKEQVAPVYLDGSEIGNRDSDSLRALLAEWMTSPRNPYFAKAMVNRTWSWFFGRGIVDPVDDFRSTNPPTHPELLDALARDFVEHDYDLKHLFRTIVQSRAYQLSSDANETNLHDELNYARSRPRMLDGVVLAEAITHATGVKETFTYDGFIGGGELPPGTRATQLIPDICPSQFMNDFGRSSRAGLPERYTEPTVAQALHRLAGSLYNENLDKAGGRIDKLIKSGANDEEAVEALYLAVLCRRPSPQEKTEVTARLKSGSSRPENLKALLWALISSQEFLNNH